MIDIDGKIISFKIFEQKFCCDLEKCKGKCCIEGDLGAPLTEEEIYTINNIIGVVKNYLTQEAQEIIKERGFYELLLDNEKTTNLCENGMCIFANIAENGIYYCVFEKLYNEKIIDFLKPISCNLYPIRTKQYSTMETLNYDEWNICKDAISKGEAENINIFRFLKEPLIRKYGQQWYDDAIEGEKWISLKTP